MTFLIELAGWIGMVCVLGGYVLLSSGKLTAQSPAFHILNLVGAAGFIINTYVHWAIPSMVLNIIWMGVASVALIRIKRAAR